MSCERAVVFDFGFFLEGVVLEEVAPAVDFVEAPVLADPAGLVAAVFFAVACGLTAALSSLGGAWSVWPAILTAVASQITITAAGFLRDANTETARRSFSYCGGSTPASSRLCHLA